MYPDPTADAGIDIGQRWYDSITDEHFIVKRTYRDNPINPTFLVHFYPASRQGIRTLTLAYIDAYCERT